MSPEHDRLEARVDTLFDRYERMAEQLHRLDERGHSAEDERREMRQALKEAMSSVRDQIKEEITTQLALQLAAQVKDQRWSVRDRVPIYAATLTSAGALLAVVIK
jgi:ElaB/YqjD/DUF883 family membrane-anchored ribosome-binding protein